MIFGEVKIQSNFSCFIIIAVHYCCNYDEFVALKRSFVASVPTIAVMKAQNFNNIVVFLKINKCYTINFYGSIRSRYNQNNFLANLSLRNVFICCENQVLSSSDGYFSWNFVLSLLVPIYVLFRGEQRYSLQTFRNTVDPKTQ